MLTIGRQVSFGRGVREHQVLHVSAELPESDESIDRARSEIIKWAQNRSGTVFSSGANLGEGFEFFAAGRSSAGVKVDLPNINAWALRQEDPDRGVAGRVWTSEAILWKSPGQAPKFAARLIAGTAEADFSVEPAVPGYVRQLIDGVGLWSAGRRLSAKPWRISANSEENKYEFIDFLLDPRRKLPVIAISESSSEQNFSINGDKLAAAVCGIAFVVIIPAEISWFLTDNLSKKLSVFEGATRIYMPGFDDDSDPYAHPLWLGSRLVREADVLSVEHEIRSAIARHSTRAVRMGKDILPFAQLRSLSRKATQDRLQRSGASEAAQLEAATARIDALEKELSEAKELEVLALEEEERARLRAEDAERREHNVTSRLQVFLQKADEVGESGNNSECLPVDWKDFDEWCDSAMVGRLVLTASARRGCKKALYNDVEQAARCLIWLATECRDRFLKGGGSLRDEPIEDGIRNALCGGDQYAFDWQGRKLNAEWHVKTGGNTRAPEKCLRIYYGWDDQTQQVVIADMPAHRKTAAS